MKYAVMTIWKHTNAMTGMARKLVLVLMTYLKKQRYSGLQSMSIIGSLVTYSPQEVYEGFKTTLEEWRKEQVETLDIEKTMEAVGLIRVDVES